MVTKAVTVMSGKVPSVKGVLYNTQRGLAHRNNNAAALIDAGLALIREQLSDDVVESVVVAERCGVDLGDVQWLHRVGVHSWATEGAKAYYRAALPCAAHAAVAASFLRELRKPYVPITYAQATAMLHALFASMTGKLRQDEAAMAKLASCADIFSPASRALGRALDLWEPVPMHPVSLALAIKRLKASKTFEPSEVELREALGEVETKSARLERAAREWLSRLRQTDALMFETDRDGWHAAHAAADSNATAQFGDDDNNNNDAYSEAIQAMWEEKYEREQAAWLAEQEQTNTPALAACAQPAAKRTKKLNMKPKTEEGQ